LIAFLKKGELTVPTAIATPPVGAAANAGFVTPSFLQGTLLFKNQDDNHYRLIWDAEEAKDRRRALPAGDYVLTGYTITSRDKHGKEWHIAASAKMIAKLKVEAGATQPFKLDETIHIHFQSRVARRKLIVSVGVHGEHHSGLSIYKEGKRIPLDWQLTDASQKTLADGKLQYG
jgi:hypothetical protein